MKVDVSKYKVTKPEHKEAILSISPDLLDKFKEFKSKNKNVKTKIFIVKFIPNNIDDQCVIHKIKMPNYNEKGFYRETESWNSFSTGKRKGLTKDDRMSGKTTCCWSPIGLYYTHDCHEDEWLRKNENRLNYYRKRTDISAQKIEELLELNDERKFPTIEHASLYDFYDYIGFDRKTRKYK